MKAAVGDTGASKIVIGWLEPGSSRRDAVDYAKNFAVRHFDAPRVSWYAVMPFMGGWFYEVQEAGTGRSFLPAVAKSLSSGNESGWIRVGERAMSAGLRDGRPFCVLMSQEDSALVIQSEVGKLVPTAKMQRVIKRGTGMLVSGLSVAACGILFLGGASAFSILSQKYVPSERTVNVDLLPHAQWDRVGNVPSNLFVQKLELVEGEDRWKTNVLPIQRTAEPGVNLSSPPVDANVAADDIVTDVIPEDPATTLIEDTAVPLDPVVVDTPPVESMSPVEPVTDMPPADPIEPPATEQDPFALDMLE